MGGPGQWGEEAAGATSGQAEPSESREPSSLAFLSRCLGVPFLTICPSDRRCQSLPCEEGSGLSLTTSPWEILLKGQRDRHAPPLPPRTRTQLPGE